MFKVLESYNFIMERTEFPAVALVALLNEVRSKANWVHLRVARVLLCLKRMQAGRKLR